MSEFSPTEYVTLDNRFRWVFREPSVVDLVCRQTNQRIRRLVKPRGKKQRGNHPLWRAYLAMICSSRADLHPPGNTSSMSINAQISMSRWVGDLIQLEIESILDALENGRTIVSTRELKKDGSGRKTIIIHPDAEIDHKHGGHIILTSLITPWNRHIKRIDETTAELQRLKQELEDGLCDGDAHLSGGGRLPSQPARGEE